MVVCSPLCSSMMTVVDARLAIDGDEIGDDAELLQHSQDLVADGAGREAQCQAADAHAPQDPGGVGGFAAHAVNGA